MFVLYFSSKTRVRNIQIMRAVVEICIFNQNTNCVEMEFVFVFYIQIMPALVEIVKIPHKFHLYLIYIFTQVIWLKPTAQNSYIL